MNTKNIINDIFEIINNNLNQTQDVEIKDKIKELIKSRLHSLDIVSRDEFEIQKKILNKAQEKIDSLELKIKKFKLKKED